MNNLVTRASELIYQMDNQQLNEVIEAIKLKRQYLAKQAVRSFMVGDMVQFTSSKTGGRVNGTIRKVNRKYIVVEAHIGGGQWRVPATMLTKISEIA